MTGARGSLENVSLTVPSRIGVGATFFRAGLLKYNSFEFAVRLFQEE
jgi:putative oxidoreductase